MARGHEHMSWSPVSARLSRVCEVVAMSVLLQYAVDHLGKLAAEMSIIMWSLWTETIRK